MENKFTYEVWINPELRTRRHWQLEKPIIDRYVAESLFDYVTDEVATQTCRVVLLQRPVNPCENVNVLADTAVKFRPRVYKESLNVSS